MSELNDVKARFGIVGHSPKLLNAVEISVQVAPTEVTVLIQGENGTGKDVFSRIIHNFSKRKHQPFIAINCGAIPEGTMDSELFGHEKGSFTSAYEQRKGYFEEVNGGTIFLDEIAEMPLATQSRLLRVLENGEYLRVGSSKVKKTDVRLIAATNKNLIEMIRIGKFREDLYFRLNTVSISVPPLRERHEDIPILFTWFANEFADKYKRMPLQLLPAAAELLQRYHWPGNVRELKNFVEKLTVLVQGNKIDVENIHDHLDIRETYLPMHVPSGDAQGNVQGNSREIEILYKLIFDLRDELSDLKKMIYLGLRNPAAMNEEGVNLTHAKTPEEKSHFISSPAYKQGNEKNTALIDEPLLIETKERELIERALKKYKENRKKAAKELGISERTLYRKIKQYELEDKS